MKSYYRLVVAEAFEQTVRFIGVGSTREAARTAVIWAFTVLLLFFVSGYNLPLIGPDVTAVSAELRLAISAIFAILALFPIVFVVMIFLSPRKIYQQTQSEIKSLKAERDSLILARPKLKVVIATNSHKDATVFALHVVNEGAACKMVGRLDLGGRGSHPILWHTPYTIVPLGIGEGIFSSLLRVESNGFASFHVLEDGNPSFIAEHRFNIKEFEWTFRLSLETEPSQMLPFEKCYSLKLTKDEDNSRPMMARYVPQVHEIPYIDELFQVAVPE